jgi:hypothetical protein
MHTPVDARTIPTICLKPKEVAEYQDLIAKGEAPRNFFELHRDAVDANVFGVDAPKDRDGFRLEQGIGSPGNMTANSIEAYRRFGKDEPNFERNLARMQKELAACEKARAGKPTTTNGLHYGRPYNAGAR